MSRNQRLGRTLRCLGIRDGRKFLIVVKVSDDYTVELRNTALYVFELLLKSSVKLCLQV